MLHYAVAVKLIDENPASAVPNPEPKGREVLAFASPDDVYAVADELGPEHRAIPIVAAWSGLETTSTPCCCNIRSSTVRVA